MLTLKTSSSRFFIFFLDQAKEAVAGERDVLEQFSQAGEMLAVQHRAARKHRCVGRDERGDERVSCAYMSSGRRAMSSIIVW